MDRIRGQLHDVEDESVVQYLHDYRESEVISPTQPDRRRADEILQRLAPMHHRGDVFEFDPITSSKPHWPLVDVASFTNLPQITTSPTTTLGPVYQLLLTTELGRVLPQLQAALAAKESFVNQKKFPTARSVLQTLFAGADRESSEPWPWPLAEWGLASYQRGPFSRVPVVVVTGDSSWDFTLFYALRRWTSRAFWLPTWLSRNALAQRYVLSAVDRLAGRNSGEILVVTTSSNTASRDETARVLRDQGAGKRVIGTAPWADVLPDQPNRLYERSSFGVPRQLVPMEGTLTTELPTPLPRRVACDDSSELRWLTEVDVDGWAPLRNPAVSEVVLDAHPVDFQRATRSGAAYYCPATFFYSGADLETITIRPRLRQLPLIEQLRAILEPKGWHCDLSDKGVYAAETAALFNGLNRLADELKNPNLARLLRGFVFDKAGIEISGGRRSLSQRHIEAILDSKSNDVVDQLVDQKILSRGLILKCSRCRQSSWYSLDDLGNDFRCRRCRLEQRVEGRWLGKREPAWFYELAEVVHQFIEHDGDIPVLASGRHFEKSSDDVDRGIELLFFPPESDRQPHDRRRTIEVDIVASEGHRLWLGEAAKDLRPSKRRLKELRRLARDTNAHGVLFATTKQEFSHDLLKTIETTFQKERCEAVLLTDVRSST